MTKSSTDSTNLSVHLLSQVKFSYNLANLPEGREPAPRRNLFPCKSFEIPVPSRAAVVGFLIGWGIVGAMIGGFYWVTR